MKKATANSNGGREAPPPRVEEMVPKKLALWHTRTFRPIITHDELEPILASVGFAPLPLPPSSSAAPEEKASASVLWREYAFLRSASSAAESGRVWVAKAPPPPRPRLPYPRVDGLHLMTYKAFLGALEFFLGPTAVPNLLHVRTMSLTRAQDRVFDKAYRPMKDLNIDEEGILVYREGTLDHITKVLCSQSSCDNDSEFSCSRIITDSCIKKTNCSSSRYNENPANLIYLGHFRSMYKSTRDCVWPFLLTMKLQFCMSWLLVPQK